MVGSGNLGQPDRLEQLDDARARHERLTRGRPAKSFREVFEEKLKGASKKDGDPGESDREGEEAEREAEGDDSDAHLGLAPGQEPALANPSNGRRSGKVIVKG